MSIARVITIFRKDLLDAIRDARVLVALLVPLGIGVFYNLTFDDTEQIPEATIVYLAASETRLFDELREVTGSAVRLTFHEVDNEQELRRQVSEGDADLGIVVPAGFDTAVAAGQSPALTVIYPPSHTFGGDYVAAALEPAIRALAGQAPPAVIRTVQLEAAGRGQTVIDVIGLRQWSVFAALIMMIAMIAMLAIPVVLTEETEKKTYDALVLIASHAEVIAAKALLGVTYIALMVPLLLLITRITPRDPLLFIAATAALGLTLIGLGLLMAGLFKSANQLNTWAGIFLVPVVAPAFIVGLRVPKTLERVATLLPTGGAAKLLFDSAAAERLFPDTAQSFLVIVAWGVVAYALLGWQLARRQA